MDSTRAWLILGLVIPNTSVAGAWELDYGRALQNSRRDGKPVLVVIGRGKEGWRQLLGKEWSEEMLQLIREHFHAVYVDAEDAEYGESLARLFNFGQLPALVISDRYGRTQVVRHQGQLSEGQLQRILEQHGGTANIVRGGLPNHAPPQTSQPAVSRSPALLCPT